VNPSSIGIGGSPWPIVVTDILANQGVPVAFIPTSKGGTTSTEWQPATNHSDASTLYGSMNRRIHAVGGLVAGVLFFQGESDARTNEATLQSDYEARLNTIVNTIATYFTGTKTMVGQIGYGSDSTYPGKDQIREAQVAVANTNANALLGPATYDINLSDEGGDDIHFKSDSDMSRFAARWIGAIDKEFYNGADGYGPILDETNLIYNTSTNKLIVPFTDASSPVINSGSTVTTSSFDLKNNGSSVAISSVTVAGGTIEITPTSALNTTFTITLTYASLNTAVDKAIYDSNDYPAQPFFNKTVSVATLNTASYDSIVFTISPNPVSEILKIETTEKLDSIKIINMLGMEILKTTDAELNISHLPTGLYFVKISAGNKSAVKKIIKN
jgi:hypothetical protein